VPQAAGKKGRVPQAAGMIAMSPCPHVPMFFLQNYNFLVEMEIFVHDYLPSMKIFI
jgi:hypothetical protein